jgi:CubicO group peptidase (beta-lactamase class C family)
MKRWMRVLTVLSVMPLIVSLACSVLAPQRLTMPRHVGFDSAQLARVDTFITRDIDEGKMPGAVLIVGRDGHIVKRQAYGHLQVAPRKRPMPVDAIFDLASVSKVVGTATAAMLLIEDGKLHLNDPVARYLPDFAQKDKGDVTIFHLLTHTSGLKPYEDVNVIKKERREGETQADALIRRICQLPKSYETGKKYRYSCLNFLTLARVNEIVAGESQNDLLQRRVYGPLGMKDTGYILTAQQKQRTAPTIEVNGTFLQGEVHDPLANYYGSGEHCPGNAGLYSSAPDLAIYLQMILNRGTYRGTRVFKPETIDLMTQIHSPPGVDFRRGLGWGIYWEPPYASELNHAPQHYVLGHLGYTGTYIWLDKRTNAFMVFLTNRVHPEEKQTINEWLSQVLYDVVDTVRHSINEYKDTPWHS